jgi:hypothetical protein
MATAVGFSAIPVPLSVTNGAQVDCRAMEAKTVTIEGTFTATYQVQISCDPSESPNANSWTNSGTALTAAGNVFVQTPCAWIRVQCTAFTSGTPVGRLAGMTSFA